MSRVNRQRVLQNIREAREQLQEIEAKLSNGEPLPEGVLEVLLGHAYHHLNWAWNTRRISAKEYKKFSDAEFNAWGGYPADVELPEIWPESRRRKPRSN